MPMQRASSSSLGLTSMLPSGHTTSTSARAAPYCSISAAASTSTPASTTWCGCPLRPRKFCSRSTAGAGLGDDQRAQLPGRHEQRLDVVLGVAVDERGPARQGAYLGEELPGAL